MPACIPSRPSVWRAAVLLGATVAGVAAAQEASHTGVEREPELPPGALRRVGTSFLRAPGRVHRVALSPDGTWVATGGGLGEIRLWSLPDRTCQLPDHLGEVDVDALAFSADGRYLAAVAEQFLLHDLPAGTTQALAIPKLGLKVSLAQAADGAWLVADENVVVRIAGDAVTEVGGRRELIDPDAVALAPDGSLLATSDEEAGVRVVDAVTGAARVRCGPLPELDLATLAIGGGRAVLGGGYEGGMVFVVDHDAPDRPRGFLAHADAVTGVALDATGTRMATVGAEGVLRTWDAATGERLADVALPFETAEQVVLRTDGRFVAVAGAHGARVWDASTGRPVVSDLGSPDPITRAALSADGTLVAEFGSDAHVRVWDVATGRVRALAARHRESMADLAFGADGALVTVDETGIVRRWDLATGRTLPLAGGHGLGGRSVAFAPDGAAFVVGGRDARLGFWDSATGAWKGTTDTAAFLAAQDHEFVSRVAWSPDGGRLALSGADDDLLVVRVPGGDRRAASDEHSGKVTSIAWAPDAERLATVRGGTLRVHDAESLDTVWSNDSAWRVAAFSPDGAVLLAGDAEGGVSAFDARTLTAAGTYAAHAHAIHSLAFSADGSRVLTAARTALVWDAATWLEHAPGTPVAHPTWEEPAPDAPGEMPAPPTITGLEPGEAASAYDGGLPGAADRFVRAVLVLDGTSGEPLEGATVATYAEDETSPPGGLIAQARTDRRGLAQLGAGGSRDTQLHLHVSAPGRATQHWYVRTSDRSPARAPRTVMLFPETPVRARLLGPLGQPAAGVHVEWFRGCGHSPAAARGVTDERGLLDLRGFTTHGSGHLWPVRSGLASRYLDVDLLTALGDAPYTWVLHHGHEQRGRVVGADGWPVAGATVKSHESYRGPIVETDASGAFVLTGFTGSEELRVWDALPGGQDFSILEQSPSLLPDLPRTVRLPARFGTLEESHDLGRLPTTFRVTDAATGAPIDDVGVRIADLTSGWQTYVMPDDGNVGAVTASLRPGPHVVAVGNPFDPFVGEAVEVEVSERFGGAVTLRASPQPRAALELPADLEDPDLHLAIDGASAAYDETEAAHVPAQGRAVLHVTAEGITRLFAFGPAHDGRRTAHVEWPQRKRILLPPLPRTAEVTCEDAAIEVFDEQGATVVLTHAIGAITLRLADDRRGIARVRARLPDRPDALVRVSDVTWQRVPMLRLRPSVGGVPLGEDGDLDAYAGDPADGEVTRLDLQTNDAADEVALERTWDDERALLLHGAGLVPKRIRAPGPAADPIPVAWGAGSLRIAVSTPQQPQPAFVAWIDGALVDAPDGVLELAGLDAGRLEVLVGLSGQATQLLQLDLSASAQREITIAYR